MEGIAGDQGQPRLLAGFEEIVAARPDDQDRIDAVGERAVGGVDPDQVALGELAEAPEVGVAVCGERRVTALARERGANDVPDAAPQRLPAGPLEHQLGEIEARNLDAADQAVPVGLVA